MRPSNAAFRHTPRIRSSALSQRNPREEISMSMDMYPQSTNEIEDRRRTLVPQQLKTFHEFSRQVFSEGVLGAKVKQLIAVAVAHTTQCPYCIRGHTAGRSRPARRPKRSWRRSGSRQRCAQAPLTLIRRSRSTPCKRMRKSSDNESTPFSNDGSPLRFDRRIDLARVPRRSSPR